MGSGSFAARALSHGNADVINCSQQLLPKSFLPVFGAGAGARALGAGAGAAQTRSLSVDTCRRPQRPWQNKPNWRRMDALTDAWSNAGYPA